MASGWTNKGHYTGFDIVFRTASAPTSYKIHLVTSAVAPTADTNTMADLTEIATGNGYATDGINVARSSSGFSGLTEDDTNKRADLTLAPITITASGGTIPPSGSGARYAVLTDDNGTVASRKIFCYADLGSDVTITSGSSYVLSAASAPWIIRLTASTNGWTDRGAYRYLDALFRGATLPTNFYVPLVTSAVAPSATTNTLSDLTQIATGNGYTTGGFQLSRNSTDFDTLTEDDANDRARMMLKDVTWTASGGNIPSSGSGARYACLSDDNATVGSREIWWFWSLTSDRTATTGQTIRLADFISDGNS